jgi:hypothetical protein
VHEAIAPRLQRGPNSFLVGAVGLGGGYFRLAHYYPVYYQPQADQLRAYPGDAIRGAHVVDGQHVAHQVRQVGGFSRFRGGHGEVMGMASAPETSVRRQRKLAAPCCRRMCDHHKPAHKLQRFAFYLLAGMAVALSQYNW